jgi:DNA-binding transcriptional LysR family regulator
MKKWDRVEAFVAVVEKGSFTAAADSLGVSPSHISRQVADLEQQLSTQLIFRTTRSIRLSDAGEQYYQECSQLLRNFIQAEEKISQQQNELSGELKVTCSTTFGERFVAPLIPRFLKKHPKLKIDLHLSNTRVNLIRDGFDVAIRLAHSKIPACWLADCVIAWSTFVRLPNTSKHTVRRTRSMNSTDITV